MHRLTPLLVLSLLLAACGETPDAPAATGFWGEPVAGLVLGLEPAQTSFTVEEDMAFTVRAKNVGETPLVLGMFEDRMWWYRLEFRNLDDGPDFDAANEELIDYDEPPDRTLQPGEPWTREVPLTKEGRFLRVIPNRQPGDDWDYRARLPPGRYGVRLEYAWATAEPRDYWTGRVRSNAFEVEITPAP